MRYAMVFIATAGVLPSPATGAAVEFACPVRIELRDIASSKLPNWELVEDKGKVERSLESVTLFDGHPDEMASLVPETSKASEGKLYSEWRLFHEPDRPFWIACIYRNSMSMLVRRLPISLKSCRLTQRLLPNGRLAGVESFACE
jgi:hypothetical protein